jgi:hypothetical protein
MGVGMAVSSLVWLMLECALFAGNENNLNHGGNIANKYLRISENIFQQSIEIRLTSHQTPYFQAFPAITSQE